MLVNALVCAVYLAVSIFLSLITYETIKTGRAPIGRAGRMYVERDRSPLAYQVRVAVSCLVSLVFIVATVGSFYTYFIR
jgi:hypothetical protein